ncbi:MAG: hypothetical protein WCJ39_01340 [bacterium]
MSAHGSETFVIGLIPPFTVSIADAAGAPIATDHPVVTRIPGEKRLFHHAWINNDHSGLRI